MNKKFTDEEAAEIRRLHRLGMPARDLVEKFRTNHTTIYQVLEERAAYRRPLEAEKVTI